MKSITIPLLVVGLTLALLVGAGPVICPKCGWEMTEHDRVCTHCGAELPQPKPVEKVSDRNEEGRAGKLFVEPEIVEAEITQGIDQLKSGSPELARLFFKNASALNLLTEHPPGVVDERSNRVLQLTMESEQQMRMVRRLCEQCGGSGKKSMTITTLDGKVERKEVSGSVCPACDGRGYVVMVGTIDEQKFRMGKALSLYATLQQGRRMVRMGEAWVPQKVADQLSVVQRVLLKRTLAAPCPDCMGLGRTDCRKCQGLGRVKCPNPGCENGLVSVESGGLLTETRLKRKEKCKVCGGVGSVACTECKGNGSVLCRKCNGTGDRALCRRCNGEGLTPCSSCKGSGSVGGQPCVECKGQGVVECPSCGGDGRTK